MGWEGPHRGIGGHGFRALALLREGAWWGALVAAAELGWLPASALGELGVGRVSNGGGGGGKRRCKVKESLGDVHLFRL